jgi:septal ring factor EnvC (AmiA/AmiB activator)
MHKVSLFVFLFLTINSNLFSQSKKELKAENSNLLRIIALQNAEIKDSRRKLDILDKEQKKLIIENNTISADLKRTSDSASVIAKNNYLLSKELTNLKTQLAKEKLESEKRYDKNTAYGELNNLNSKNQTKLLTIESSKASSIHKAQKSYTRKYYRGPRGGCYYINSNGNKSYVPRELCN